MDEIKIDANELEKLDEKTKNSGQGMLSFIVIVFHLQRKSKQMRTHR